jgi:hypothetical protein
MQQEFFTNFANLREECRFVICALECFEELTNWPLHCIDQSERAARKIRKIEKGAKTSWTECW